MIGKPTGSSIASAKSEHWKTDTPKHPRSRCTIQRRSEDRDNIAWGVAALCPRLVCVAPLGQILRKSSTSRFEKPGISKNAGLLRHEWSPLCRLTPATQTAYPPNAPYRRVPRANATRLATYNATIQQNSIPNSRINSSVVYRPSMIAAGV